MSSCFLALAFMMVICSDALNVQSSLNNSNSQAGSKSPEDKLYEEIKQNLQLNENGKKAANLANQLVARLRILHGNQSAELAKALELAVEAHYYASDPVALLAAGKESSEIYNGIKGSKWKAANVAVNTENFFWLIKRPLPERIEYDNWNGRTIREINALIDQANYDAARKRIADGIARLNAIYQGSAWKLAHIPIVAKYLYLHAIVLKSEGKLKDSIELNTAILAGLTRTYQTELVYLTYRIHADLADAYYKELELERAEMHARKAYDIVVIITEPDDYQRVQCMLKIATLCMERGQTGLALQLANQAIQSVKVHPPSDQVLTALTYDTAANICINVRPVLAVERSQEACRILTKLGKTASSEFCYASINLGHGYRMQRKLEDARRAYEDAINKAKQISLARANASALIGLAKCELEAERYDLVEDHYRKARELLVSIRGENKLFMDNIDAGLVTLARRRIVKSLKDRNLDLAREQLSREIELTVRRHSDASTRARLIRLERDAFERVAQLSSDRYAEWLQAYLQIADDLFTLFEGTPAERLSKSQSILATMERTVGKEYFLNPHLKAEAGMALYDLREGKKSTAMLTDAVQELSRQWPDSTGFHRLHKCRFLLGRLQTTNPETRVEGLANIEQAARGMKILFGPLRDYAAIITPFAFDLMEAGEFQRAEAVASEALELNERLYGKSSGACIQARRIYADLCLRQGDATRAVSLIREVIEACEKRQESTVVIAGDTILLGQALFRQASIQEAEKTLNKALQMTSDLKDLPSEYGQAHYLLGQIFTGKKLIPDAIKHFEQAATFYESKRHFHAIRRNDSRNALANLEFDQAMAAVLAGDLAMANGHHESAIKQLRKFAKDDDWRIKEHQSFIASNMRWDALAEEKKMKLASVWQGIVKVNQLDRQNQFNEVVQQGLPLIPQVEDLLGKDDYRCTLLGFMLVRSLFQVNHPQRYNIFEAARTGHNRWLGTYNNHTARMYLQLAHHLRNTGQAKAALPQYESANKIYLMTTPQGLDVQIALFRHAQIYCELDVFPAGITEMRQTLRNLRVFAGSEPSLYVEVLCSNSMLSSRLCDFDLAKVQLDEAQSFVTTRKMEGTPAEFFLRAGMTQYHLATRNWNEAEKHARQWNEIVIKAGGKNSGELATAQIALATCLLRKGDLLAATPMAELALAQAQRTRSSELAPIADAKILLAQIRCQSRDPSAGYQLAKEAVAEYSKRLSASHRKTLFAWENVARAATQQGDLSSAAEAREQLLKLNLEQLDRLALVTSGDQFLELSSQARDALYGYLSLPASNQSVDIGYQALLRLKGITLHRQKQFLMASRKPTLEKLVGTWRQHGADLATEALRPPFAEGLVTWLQSLAQTYTNLNAIEAQLAKEAKIASPVSVQDIIQALSPESSLVDYLLYSRLEPVKDQPGQWSEIPHYCAFILRPNQPVIRVELGVATAVEKSITAWQKHLEQLNTTPVVDHVKKIPEARDILDKASQAIWIPVANHVKDASLLFISPDGPLAALPFTAFRGSKANDFLIEEKTILIVPAARLLLEKQQFHQEPSLLVIGQVDYGAMPGTARNVANDKSITGGFTILTEDHIECNSVNQQYERKYPKSQRTYLTGSQTTERAFRQNANQYRWLHVSTHGFFQEKFPWTAILSRSSTSSLTNSKPMIVGNENYANRVLAHPGLQCGIGLAGANVINRYGQDDGILSALEVSMLDLSQVEMIFLSACQTAQGSNKNGEGVLGLQRAFHQAGVHSVVATLWSVPVNETSKLVDMFYGQLWSKSKRSADALQSAQVRFIRDARGVAAGQKTDGIRSYQLHPFYWAGFSISGASR